VRRVGVPVAAAVGGAADAEQQDEPAGGAGADRGGRPVEPLVAALHGRGPGLECYCLYEASSPDAILAAARRAGLPADSIVEVDRVEAAMFA